MEIKECPRMSPVTFALYVICVGAAIPVALFLGLAVYLIIFFGLLALCDLLGGKTDGNSDHKL